MILLDMSMLEEHMFSLFLRLLSSKLCAHGGFGAGPTNPPLSAWFSASTQTVGEIAEERLFY